MRSRLRVMISRKFHYQVSNYSLDLTIIVYSTAIAALIHQAVLVKRKDIRKFLDGIYVSDKTTIDPVE